MGVEPKEAIRRRVHAARDSLIGLSHVIWDNPELAFEEELARIHDLRMPGRNAYYEACYAAFRDVHATLGAARPDILLVDATRAFADLEEVAFVDHCHLATAGRARLAAALGAAIAARLETRGR